MLSSIGGKLISLDPSALQYHRMVPCSCETVTTTRNCQVRNYALRTCRHIHCRQNSPEKAVHNKPDHTCREDCPVSIDDCIQCRQLYQSQLGAL